MENVDEIKVVFLGSSGVGKSSILQRFVTGVFSTEMQATLGASFISKKMTVKNRTVKFQIWDTAGQEKYHSMSQMYYRDVSAAILVFDVTNQRSYEDMKNWREELFEKGPPGIVVGIVGNKTDLLQKNDEDDELDDMVNSKSKPVDLNQAQQYANEMDAIFIAASAKIGKGVQEVFTYIAEKASSKPPKETKSQIFLDDETENQQRRASCCSSGQKNK